MKRLTACLLLLALLFSGAASAAPRAIRPTAIVIRGGTPKMGLGESGQWGFAVKPALASTLVSWASSNKNVIIVSSEGLVTAVGVGRARVRVRSRLAGAVEHSVSVTVTDPSKPISIAIEDGRNWVKEGDRVNFIARVAPATAPQEVACSSSRPDVLRIDETGRATAIGAGTATITAAAGALKDTRVVTVAGSARVTRVPARYTALDTAEIARNQAEIMAIFDSAVSELARLTSQNTIAGEEFKKRRGVLINAFDMARVAWYTEKVVPYWSDRYSMGGKKHFRPNRAYYGMPYIQSGQNNARGNRRFNVQKAIAGKYLVKGKYGIYRMTTQRMAGHYVGSDCSSFAGMSIFPVRGDPINSTVCQMLTSSIAVSGVYRTLGGYEELQPGDVLVKSGDHVVMFLYYIDSAKSRMMIIEQGGGSAADIHNTACCSVVNRATYEGRYVPRRARFLSA